MATATAFSTVYRPLMVDAGIQGKWTITSRWDRKLADKVLDFLTHNAFPFYGVGVPPSEEAAKNLIRGAWQKAEAGIPFTRFPVLDSKKNVIGEFGIDFDENPRKLQLAGRGLATMQGLGIGTEILDWCLRQYLPELHRQGVRLPVYAEGQGDVPWKERHVVEWLDLRNVSLVATVHPDHIAANKLLLGAGFLKVAEVVKERFEGARDGRRNVYEIALKTLI